MSFHVTAVVVTFNRSALLVECLDSLVAGTRVPDRILVVDNASTDDTEVVLADYVAKSEAETDWVVERLAANSGGAGGFSYGLQRAFALGSEFSWIMDDDVLVEAQALAELVTAWRTSPDDWFASVAVGTEDQSTFSWSLHLLGESGAERIWERDKLGSDAPARASFAPFVGLGIPRRALETVGVPNPEFFIWSDDIDYCYRARDAGHTVWYVPKSVVRHPVAPRSVARFGPWRYTTVKAPLWKRYFGLRNDIHISLKQRAWGRLAKYCAIAAASWLDEEDRKAALSVYMLAIKDGFLGRLGRGNPVWDTHKK